LTDSGIPAATIVETLEQRFELADFPDFSGAHNGVQLEPPELIRCMATAVDACGMTSHMAAEQDADLLLVHHGMLWGGPKRIVGPQYATVAPLIRSNCGLISIHLPLDGDAEFGNNALICAQLGLERTSPFGYMKGITAGWLATTKTPLTAAAASEKLSISITEAVAPSRPVETLAVVSGSAGSLIDEARAANADVLLTGECNHHDRVWARDAGLGLWLGGHYNTETFGVRAVGEWLADRYNLRHVFLDAPTGG